MVQHGSIRGIRNETDPLEGRSIGRETAISEGQVVARGGNKPNVSSGSEYRTFLKDKGTTVPDPKATLDPVHKRPVDRGISWTSTGHMGIAISLRGIKPKHRVLFSKGTLHAINQQHR